MDLEEILHRLEEARELLDWDIIDECMEALRDLIENPLDGYDEEDIWGWTFGIDRCYSTTKCSRDWVGLVTKDSQT